MKRVKKRDKIKFQTGKNKKGPARGKHGIQIYTSQRRYGHMIARRAASAKNIIGRNKPVHDSNSIRM